MMSIFKEIKEFTADFHFEKPTFQWKYGTAGFRYNSIYLRQCVARCGIVAVVLSKKYGASMGIMITASHNLDPDNGVKLVGPDGAMMAEVYEQFVTDAVNRDDFDVLLQEFMDNNKLDNDFSKCHVVLGYDTRASSIKFATDINQIVAKMGASVFDCKAVTTPIVHFVTCYHNLGGVGANTQFYFDVFTDRVQTFLDLLKKPKPDSTRKLIMDCAFGVGGIHAASLHKALSKFSIELDVRNIPGENPVNNGAGSDFVQTKTMCPANIGFESKHHDEYGTSLCSIDGDGDRLVYYYEEKGKFNLVDGDRQAFLALEALVSLINVLPINTAPRALTIGLVQTAYCNGAVEDAIKKHINLDNNLIEFTREVVCTGVKNLHRAAVKYDIAIYFEANGHGSLVYKDEICDWGDQSKLSSTVEFKTLLAYLRLFNPVIGDAFTDVLVFEASLFILGKDIKYIHDLFPYYHNQIWKIPVPRSLLDTLKPHPDHEMWLIEPLALQNKLKDIYSKARGSCRVFIRPSGTEDVLRAYAETSDASELSEIVEKVNLVLQEFVKSSL